MADDETLPDEGIASSAARNINKLAIIFFSGFFNLFFFLCRYEDRCVSLEGPPATEHVQTAVLCFLNLLSALPALVDKQKRKKATKKKTCAKKRYKRGSPIPFFRKTMPYVFKEEDSVLFEVSNPPPLSLFLFQIQA